MIEEFLEKAKDYSHQNVNKKTARRQIVRAGEIVASVEKVLNKW